MAENPYGSRYRGMKPKNRKKEVKPKALPKSDRIGYANASFAQENMW